MYCINLNLGFKVKQYFDYFGFGQIQFPVNSFFFIPGYQLVIEFREKAEFR